jgi:hypothetical protein
VIYGNNMFIIRYERTGLEIKVDNKRAYLMMRTHELEELGFKPNDVWDGK